MARQTYDDEYYRAQLSKSDLRVALQYGQLLAFAGCTDKSARVLDAGCGAAPGLRYLAQQGWTPYGVDLVWYPLVKARELVPTARLTRCDLTQPLPFRENFLDVILMSEIIEHLPDPEAALREVYRVLRANGAVVLTTPNLWDVRRLYLPLLARVWSGEADPTHQHLFNPRSLRALLLKVGFTRVRIRTGIKPWLYLSSRKLKVKISIPYPPQIGNGVLAVGFKKEVHLN